MNEVRAALDALRPLDTETIARLWPHWRAEDALFVYAGNAIHPFMDGDGRTARLLQNLDLVRVGYAPILIGPAEKARYLDVLQSAQIAVPGTGDATSFVAYIVELETLAMERYLRTST